MISLILLFLASILIMERMGFWRFKFILLGLIFCIIICGLGFTIASVTNMLFQGKEWYDALKAYDFYSYTNTFTRDHDGSVGWLMIGALFYGVIDMIQIYLLYCFKFSTIVTWIVNIFCWHLCYIGCRDYVYVFIKK